MPSSVNAIFAIPVGPVPDQSSQLLFLRTSTPMKLIGVVDPSTATFTRRLGALRATSPKALLKVLSEPASTVNGSVVVIVLLA